MQLTTFTDYALRTLMYAGLRDPELSHIDDIAGAYAISRNTLMKVVHFLGETGYLENIRGKNGGLRLAHPPEEIIIGELIRRTEDRLEPAVCFSPGSGHCQIEKNCRLTGILNEAMHAFFQVLDQYSLGDLLKPGNKLARDLGIKIAKVNKKGK